MTSKAQQIKLDNALVAPENHRVIGKCNMRINLGMKPKEPTYQVVLDALALTTCYHAFLITAEVLVIYMHQEILNICHKVLGKAFDEPPTEEEALSFIRELGHIGEIRYITDVIVDHLHQPWRTFASIIYTNRGEPLHQSSTNVYVERHANTQVYGVILPQAMTNQALLDSVAYKTYYAIASGAEPPKSRKSQKKSESAISSEEYPSKKKPAKAKKDAATKPKPTKKKAPVKADRGKGLNVLSEVALSKAAQLKEATKLSKKEFHASHASGSGDGIDLGSGVPDEQHHKTSCTDEGTSTKLRVLDVPKYESDSEQESWGDSDEEDDDDEDDSGDESDDGDNDDDYCDKYVGDNNDGKDDDEADSERTESNREEIPDLNQSNEEREQQEEDVDKRVHTPDDYELTDEENIDDEDKMDEEENDDITKELYKDVNVNLGNEDAEMIHDDQGGADEHNVSQESGFVQEDEDAHVTLTTVHDTQKTEADNEIASLMDTIIHYEEPSSHTSSLHTVPITVIPEVTSTFTTTIPPPPPFFNPLQQQATLTQTPITFEATTSFPELPDFSFVFKFNERVTNLEHDLSLMKQVDQYAQALSSLPAIIHRYINNKLGEAMKKAIQSHNAECKEEAQAEKQEYIDLVDTSVRTILREESSSQPKSTYEVAASLSEFKLTKILIDKIEKNKSYDKGDYKRELYDALVKSYQTEKDLFDTYGEVFTRKSSKEAEPSKYSSSKEKKSSSTSKGTSQSQHKSFGKSAHTEEPSHTVDDSEEQHNQEFDMDHTDDQPDIKAAPNQVAHAKDPPTSFDKLYNTLIDFSAFVLNRLNIIDLNQEILVGPAFNLLKGTCKSLTELEYYFEECSKATTERLDWHNPEGKPYLFDL
ncbi:hypothetical protein Tco_1261655 [Tanacetum coccineum]